MRSASRPRFTAAIIAALATAALLPATASANHNDDFVDMASLALNTVVNDNNVGASIEPPEAYTASDDRCEGQAMGGTLWWKFTGNGQPVTVSTKGSTIDTLLGVFTTAGNSIACSDDVANNQNNRHSEVRINTTAGAEYWVQVGGLCLSFDAVDDCDDWREGNVSVAAWTRPGNDTRAGAIAIHDHHQQTFETRGAREDAGELTQCGTSTFGKTVWFRFDAPSKGTAHFTASGFDTVMAIYDGGSAGFMDCHDDPQVSGPSHRAIEIAPNHSYYVQVGGFGSGRAADAGKVDMLVTFAQDTDWDDDGAAGTAWGGADCQDENPYVKPGIDDVVNNDVDDNCDQFKDYDRDGDGFRVTVPVRNPKPTNWDCNDTPGIGSRINPKARDVRGNSLNEDCKGGAAKALGLPSGVTDNWGARPGGAFVRSMKVNPVLKGSRIKVSCSGPGCAFRSRAFKMKRRAKAFVLTRLFGGRTLGSGARVAVKVLPPSIEWIGRTESYRVLGSTVRSSKGCINRRGKRVRCPS